MSSATLPEIMNAQILWVQERERISAVPIEVMTRLPHRHLTFFLAARLAQLRPDLSIAVNGHLPLVKGSHYLYASLLERTSWQPMGTKGEPAAFNIFDGFAVLNESLDVDSSSKGFDVLLWCAGAIPEDCEYSINLRPGMLESYEASPGSLMSDLIGEYDKIKTFRPAGQRVSMLDEMLEPFSFPKGSGGLPRPVQLTPNLNPTPAETLFAQRVLKFEGLYPRVLQGDIKTELAHWEAFVREWLPSDEEQEIVYHLIEEAGHCGDLAFFVRTANALAEHL